MQLNIINPTALSFHEAVGISEERANQLGGLLDEMFKKYKGQIVRTCDLFNEIAQMSDNIEELIFCTVSHCNYMAVKYGIFLCPPKQKI